MINSSQFNKRMLAHACRLFSSDNIIGFVGLGNMGSGMAANLVAAGFAVHGFDPSWKALKDSEEKGVIPCQNLTELTSKSKVLISMLPNDQLLFDTTGSESFIKSLKHDTLHISCATVSPHTSRDLFSLYKSHQRRFLAAPVFARPDGIVRRQATFMVSGTDRDISEAEPLLKTSGQAIFRFNKKAQEKTEVDVGAANVVKLTGNFLIGAAIESISEALTFAERNGVDRVEVMNMLTSTIFNCLIYKGYGDRISTRDHKPGGFSLTLGLKDVSLVQSTAAKSHTPMPIVSLLQDRYQSSYSKGRGQMDWSALGLLSSEDAGIDVSDAINRNKMMAAAQDGSKKPKGRSKTKQQDKK